MKTTITRACMAALATALLLTSAPTSLFAQLAEVYQLPAAVEVEQGEEFTLQVRVNPNGESVSVADVFMLFDPEFLEVTAIQAIAEGLNQNHLPGTWDNEAGEFHFGAFRITGDLPAGDFGLFEVTLRGLEPTELTRIEHLESGLPSTLLAFAGTNRTGSLSATDIHILPAGSTSGIAQGASIEGNLTIWPVPSEGQVFSTFEVATTTPVSLEIFDIAGNKVAAVFQGTATAGTVYRFDFDGRSLANGVYLYRLTTENGMHTKRMIIAR
jgi:hypothetical protein